MTMTHGYYIIRASVTPTDRPQPELLFQNPDELCDDNDGYVVERFDWTNLGVHYFLTRADAFGRKAEAIELVAEHGYEGRGEWRNSPSLKRSIFP